MRRCKMRFKLVKGLLIVLLVLGLSLPGCATFSIFPLFPQDSADRAQALANDIQMLKQNAGEDGTVTVLIKLQGTSIGGFEEDDVVEELSRHAAQSQKKVLELLYTKGATVLNAFWLTNAILAEVPVGLLDELSSLADIERLFENFTIAIPEPQEEEDLPQVLSIDYTWGLEKLRVPDVWDMGIDGSGVRVAVLDTGVDITHADLAGKMWTDDWEDPTYPGGWIEFDEYGSIIVGSTPHDTYGHGTHCSGTVLGGDASGIAIGVAPDATLMHGLVVPGGYGTVAQIIAGMEWCIDPFDQYGAPAGEPADVVSMSLGYYGYNDPFIEPVQNMKAAGIVLTASIGNDGEGYSGSPGNVYETFAVGATHYEDLAADFSGGEVVDWPASYPEPYIKPDFSAPGVGVYSSVPGGYEYHEGTSMASPHVAGTVALMLDGNPALTVDDVYTLLRDTAVDLGDEGQDTRYGWGRIDAFEAVFFAASNSGIEGTVTNVETEQPLESARIFVSETGQIRYSDDSGYYRAFLPPGTYNVTASTFGYYQGNNATVEVVEDAFTSQDFALEPMPTGLIAGNVTDLETSYPIENAVVTVLDTPLSTNTSGTGEYSIEIPVGTYNVAAWALGYLESIASNVTVAEDETVTVDFTLESAPVAAVLGDYESQLTDLLFANNIWAEERGWDIIDDMGAYDAVVVNRPSDPGETTFLEFLEAASGTQTTVVFTSSWGGGSYGISLLQWYLGDPAGQSTSFWDGDVYYQVTEEHPIFEGWEVGESITIITGGDRDHAWFSGYSGNTIASIGSEYYGIRGDAVAVGEYGGSLHVLLAGLAPQSWTNIPDWTEDARTIFINAVSFAAGSGIEGFVSDAVTEGSLEGAEISVSETGQASYSDDSGYYHLFVPPGSYNLTASMFGYYEESAMVEVVEDAFTSQDFALAPMPTGFITGNTTDLETNDPIEGAIVALLDTPLSTTTNEAGEYSIEVPVGTYNVRALARGYRESIALNVTVAQDETVTLDFALEPGPVAAVLGDYNSQLTDLLIANDIWAEERDWDIIGDIAPYYVVVVNLPSDPGESTFMEFLEAASDNEVGVVFLHQRGYTWSWGISLLHFHLGDPGDINSYGGGDVYYYVTEEHPIFEGWDVADTITIIDAGPRDHSWFDYYTGDVIAQLRTTEYPNRGPGVGVKQYGGSQHVLLASLGVGTTNGGNMEHWTEDAKIIFLRAVGMNIELGLAIKTSELPLGFVDRGYQAMLDATGGTEPYTWNITDGALPDGLDLNPTAGVIWGTPTTVETSDFTVEVRDAEDNTAIASLALKVSKVCFIATAAYGTDTAQELDILREFRDAVLLPNGLGARLVSFYYETSPPVAGFISQNEVLRTAVRVCFIDPIVRILTWTHDLWLPRG